MERLIWIQSWLNPVPNSYLGSNLVTMRFPALIVRLFRTHFKNGGVWTDLDGWSTGYFGCVSGLLQGVDSNDAISHQIKGDIPTCDIHNSTCMVVLFTIISAWHNALVWKGSPRFHLECTFQSINLKQTKCCRNCCARDGFLLQGHCEVHAWCCCYVCVVF